MSGWIRDDLNFCRHAKGFVVSGRYAKSHGLSYSDLLTPETAERAVAALGIKPWLPSDAKLVRVCATPYQDAVTVFFVSALYPEIPDGELIDTVGLEELIKDRS